MQHKESTVKVYTEGPSGTVVINRAYIKRSLDFWLIFIIIKFLMFLSRDTKTN